MPAAQKAPKPLAAAPLKKGDHVFLVDGSGYIFRAYHALPPINRKSDGLQLNAVFGFCNMLWKLLRDMKAEDKPTHLAVVFDLSERTFRTEMYPEYKAHRPEPPDDLRPQFGLIREAVHAFDLPCLEQKGFEADDLIATYVRQACEAGATATIVSSDKDLMQLVNDCVVMFDTMKDKKIGRAEVIEKFGVPPDKVIEVQALIGDSTDNVPGVPGIGVKTAAQLIGEYGDLETLLARAGEIKQDKRRQTLIDNADKARLSKKLVTLDDKVKLDVPIGDLAVHEPDHKRLIAFLKAMEFSSLTRRVAEFAGIEVNEIEPDAKLAVGGRAVASPSSSPVSGRRTIRPKGPRRVRARLRCNCPLRRPAAPVGKEAALNPQALAAARLDIAHTQKFDHANTKPCAASTGCAPGSSAPAISVMSASIPKPIRSTRCRRSCAASRWRSRPTKPAMCRCRTARAATASRRIVPGRSRIRPDPGARRARCHKAALGRSGRAQDRPESEIRLADFRSARHRDRVL